MWVIIKSIWDIPKDTYRKQRCGYIKKKIFCGSLIKYK